HRTVEQCHLLGNQSDMLAQVAQLVVFDRHFVEQNLTIFMLVKARNQVGKCRLATAGAPDQSDHLSRVGNEADIAEHWLFAARVTEIEMTHFKTPRHPITLYAAEIGLGRFVELLENTLCSGQAFLDRRTDFRKLAYRLGQEAGCGYVR